MRRDIYFAGKIAKGDWRHEVCPELLSAAAEIYHEPHQPWPLVWGDGFVYTGPYFVSCDHGCYHGRGTHGAGLQTDPFAEYGGCGGDAYTQEEVRRQCLAAIRRSNTVFVWLDSLSAYGMLVEVGYAVARGKTIWIAHDGQDYSDLWFLLRCADKVVTTDTPQEALELLLQPQERAA